MNFNRWAIRATDSNGFTTGYLTTHWFNKSARSLCRELNIAARHAKQPLIYFVERVK